MSDIWYGSYCPTCRKPVRARKERMTGLLTHNVVINGKNEQHWWGGGTTLESNSSAPQITTTDNTNTATPTRGAFGFCRTCGVSVPVERREEHYVHEFAPGIFHIVNSNVPVRRIRRVAILETKQVGEAEWREGVKQFAGWDASQAPLEPPNGDDYPA